MLLNCCLSNQYLLSFFTFTITLVNAYASPRECSGFCNSRDPAIMRRSDGTYFRFSTGNRIGVATAPSLSGPWTSKGSALRSGAKISKNGNQDLWAPDVTKVDDTYYLVYSVSTWGSQDSEMGFATSSDLENWTDHGTTGIASSPKGRQPYNAIHGSLVYAPNGDKHYMVFGSFWGNLYLADMETIPTKNIGSAKRIAYQPSGEHAIEAGFIYEFQGTWYLFFSAGKCCYLDINRPAKGQEYKIMACRSKSPAGPYEDLYGKDCNQGGGTAILESHDRVFAPGSQGVFTDPFEGPVIYYSYVDTRVGYADNQKKFGWNKLVFRNSWPSME